MKNIVLTKGKIKYMQSGMEIKYRNYADLAGEIGCTVKTIHLAKKRGAGRSLALKLEAATGIDAERWIFPDRGVKSPWAEIFPWRFSA